MFPGRICSSVAEGNGYSALYVLLQARPDEIPSFTTQRGVLKKSEAFSWRQLDTSHLKLLKLYLRSQ